MKSTRLFAAAALVLAAAFSACSNNDNGMNAGDKTAPSRVTDLDIIATTDTTVTIQWTAPGDDGHTGKATSYQIRTAGVLINGSNFASANEVQNVPAPVAAGTVQQFTFPLSTTVVIHVALRARDEIGNYSHVSNDAVWTPSVAQHFVVDIPPFKDNSMYEESDSLSNGALPYVFSGRTQGLTGTAFLRRALLAFAVSDSIPAGAVIDSVQLTMNVSKQRTATLQPTSLHRVTADWGEGNSDSGGAGGGGAPAATNDATWGYRFFATTTWTTPGGDFNAVASATKSIGFGFNTWKSTQMKADVQLWLDTPANNFGWLMTGEESGTGTAKRLDSRENPTPANVPVLKVFYTVP